MIGSMPLLGILTGPIGPNRAGLNFCESNFFFPRGKTTRSIGGLLGSRPLLGVIRERKELERSDLSQIGIIEDHENVKHPLQLQQPIIPPKICICTGLEFKRWGMGIIFLSSIPPSPTTWRSRNEQRGRANIKIGQSKLKQAHIENADILHSLINSGELVSSTLCSPLCIRNLESRAILF